MSLRGSYRGAEHGDDRMLDNLESARCISVVEALWTLESQFL